MDVNSQEFDTVVIGAGISGIAAANFYLKIHPDCRLVILEKEDCVGGVWNSKRSYESFWAPSKKGTAEYSDMAMIPPPEVDTFNDYFKAKYTTRYLENYVDRQRFAQQSLRQRIQFGFKVHTIQKLDGEWNVSGKDNTNKECNLYAPKLIVATGLMSAPSLPDLPSQGKFGGLVVHHERFGQSSVLSDPDMKHVTVLGGGKAAASMAYASAKAGKHVSWVIRESGTGPGHFICSKENENGMAYTRFLARMSPSYLNPDTRWTRFQRGTVLGRKFGRSFWGSFDKGLRTEANYEKRPSVKGFEKLSPHTPFFWLNSSAGTLHYPDFWDTIAQNVQVYQDDIFELGKGLVRLKGGEEVPSDVLLCGTGWKSTQDFFDRDLLVELGLPHPFEDEPAEAAKKWDRLGKEADQKVLKQFPALGKPPVHHEKPIQATPYRLYNGIAPLRDDSIVFIGHVQIANCFRVAECQAIWATAYLDKQIPLPPVEEREAEVALAIAWCRRRYLSNGQQGNMLAFELMGYTDKLLCELGLSTHLLGGKLDLVSPAVPRDLRGLHGEYVRKYGNDETKVL